MYLSFKWKQVQNNSMLKPTVKPRQSNIGYLTFDIPVSPCPCCFHSCLCCISYFSFPAGTVILFPGVTESRAAICVSVVLPGPSVHSSQSPTCLKSIKSQRAPWHRREVLFRGIWPEWCWKQEHGHTQCEWDKSRMGQGHSCHVSHTGAQSSNPTEQPNRDICKAAQGTELQLRAMSSFNTSSKEIGVLLWTVDFIRNFLLIHQ